MPLKVTATGRNVSVVYWMRGIFAFVFAGLIVLGIIEGDLVSPLWAIPILGLPSLGVYWIIKGTKIYRQY